MPQYAVSFNDTTHCIGEPRLGDTIDGCGQDANELIAEFELDYELVFVPEVRDAADPSTTTLGFFHDVGYEPGSTPVAVLLRVGD